MASTVERTRWSVGGRKPVEQQHQAGSVERRLSRRTGRTRRPARSILWSRWRPGSRLGSPSTLRSGPPAPSMSGQADRPVQRHPAHQLGVDEVSGLRRGSPRSPGRAAPALAAASATSIRNRAVTRVELADLFGQRPGRVEQLAVHVELDLIPGVVADAHRAAAAMAGEVGEVVLGDVAFAADSVEDLEVLALRAARRRLRWRGRRRSRPPRPGTPPTHSASSVRLASRTQQ